MRCPHGPPPSKDPTSRARAPRSRSSGHRLGPFRRQSPKRGAGARTRQQGLVASFFGFASLLQTRGSLSFVRNIHMGASQLAPLRAACSALHRRPSRLPGSWRCSRPSHRPMPICRIPVRRDGRGLRVLERDACGEPRWRRALRHQRDAATVAGLRPRCGRGILPFDAELQLVRRAHDRPGGPVALGQGGKGPH
jgi:hypothetical protein